MTKITLKIQRHYGSKDLKEIIETLISMKLPNFNSKMNDKSYSGIDTSSTAIHKEEIMCE